MISIEGRLQIASYEKNGKIIKSAEVIADNMQMLDRKGEERAKAPETVPAEQEVPF